MRWRRRYFRFPVPDRTVLALLAILRAAVSAMRWSASRERGDGLKMGAEDGRQGWGRLVSLAHHKCAIRNGNARRAGLGHIHVVTEVKQEGGNLLFRASTLLADANRDICRGKVAGLMVGMANAEVVEIRFRCGQRFSSMPLASRLDSGVLAEKAANWRRTYR